MEDPRWTGISNADFEAAAKAIQVGKKRKRTDLSKTATRQRRLQNARTDDWMGGDLSAEAVIERFRRLLYRRAHYKTRYRLVHANVRGSGEDSVVIAVVAHTLVFTERVLFDEELLFAATQALLDRRQVTWVGLLGADASKRNNFATRGEWTRLAVDKIAERLFVTRIREKLMCFSYHPMSMRRAPLRIQDVNDTRFQTSTRWLRYNPEVPPDQSHYIDPSKCLPAYTAGDG